MSFDCLNVPVIPNPVGLDVVFNSIQTELSALPWLEYSFGRAYRMKEVRDDQDYFLPKAYGSQKEYIRLDPNDKVSAFSFIEKTSNESQNDFEIKKYSTINTITLSVVVWANLDQIDNQRDYIFSENLKQDVKNVLYQNDYVTDLEGYEDTLDEVWSTYSRPDAKFYTEKYTTFKYTFRVDYNEDCYEDNIYSNTTCQ